MSYKVCPKCNGANEAEAAFCGGCGTPLTNGQPAAGAMPQPTFPPGVPQAPTAGAPQSYPQGSYPQQSYPAQGYAPQNYAPQGYAPQGYVPQGGMAGLPPEIAQTLAAAQAAGMILPPGTVPASFRLRFRAGLIDLFILIILGYVVSAYISQALNYVVGPVYFIAMWAAKGQTVGKMVTGITVVSTDGQPLTAGKAVIRYLGYMVSGFTLGIGFLAIMFDGARRGIHDRIAGTIAVQRI